MSAMSGSNLAERFTTENDQMLHARRIREGLPKSSVLVGFPRAYFSAYDSNCPRV